MPDPLTSANAVEERLWSLADPAQLPIVSKRLASDERAIGMRMRDLFDTAKAATAMPLTEVEKLMDQEAYELRLAAFCVLDFKARKALGDPELYELYLRRHDAITSWDMVDRSAPRVVGGHLAGGPYEPLQTLARSSDPLRRRSAATAPLFFTKSGDEADLAAGFAICADLHDDSDPVVTNAVGIYLKHAGLRDPAALAAFLTAHAAQMPRPALRLAIEKLPSEERRRWLD